MIRFVDMSGQGLMEPNMPAENQRPVFGFYDSERGEFLNFGQQEIWNSWSEFERDYNCTVPKTHPLSFFRQLCPRAMPV